MVLAIAFALGDVGASAVELNDYPTSARADYVFGCMKANGDTRTALDQCSCSIDVIASLLPYDRYVEAETVLSLAQVPGFFGAMFRSPPPAKAAVDDFAARRRKRRCAAFNGLQPACVKCPYRLSSDIGTSSAARTTWDARCPIGRCGLGSHHALHRREFASKSTR